MITLILFAPITHASITWPDKVCYGYTDILFSMTRPHVFGISQALGPVVLLSALASTPAAATPARTCCLNQRHTFEGKSSMWGKCFLIYSSASFFLFFLFTLHKSEFTFGFAGSCTSICGAHVGTVCVSVLAEPSAQTLCHLYPGRESGSPHRSTHGWAPLANTVPTHPVTCIHVHGPALLMEMHN